MERPALFTKDYWRFCLKVFGHTFVSFVADVKSAQEWAALIVAALVLFRLGWSTSWLEKVPLWVWSLIAGLAFFYKLMSVLYRESSHRFKPDAQRFRVQSALYDAAQQGRNLHAGLVSTELATPTNELPSGQAIRWDEATYQLVRKTLGETEAQSYGVPNVASFPVTNMHNEVIMRVNRLEDIIRRLGTIPLEVKVDAYDFFERQKNEASDQ